MDKLESHKKNHLSFVYVIVMTFLTWTLLYHFPLINITWLWLLVGCVVSFITIKSYYNGKVFKYVAVYGLFVIANAITGDHYFNSLPLAITEVASLIFVTSALLYFMRNQDDKIYNCFLLTFFIIIITTAYLSYQIDLNFPGAIRSVTVTGFGGDRTEVSLYYAMGMGSYSMAHALPIIIPPLVMGIKNVQISKTMRLVLFVVLLATIVYIYLGSATGALMIGILSLLLSVFVRPGSIRLNLLRIIVISILFLPLLSDNVLLFVLDQFENMIGGEGAYQTKIDEFKMLILTGEQGEDIVARRDLYFQSWSSFVSNFFFGTNGKVGGHSAVLDRFATLGIFGFLAFLYFFVKQVKVPVDYINKKYLVYYFIGVFSGVLMLATKKTGYWETWLCLFLALPMLMVRLVPNDNAD